MNQASVLGVAQSPSTTEAPQEQGSKAWNSHTLLLQVALACAPRQLMIFFINECFYHLCTFGVQGLSTQDLSLVQRVTFSTRMGNLIPSRHASVHPLSMEVHNLFVHPCYSIQGMLCYASSAIEHFFFTSWSKSIQQIKQSCPKSCFDLLST